MLNPAEERVVSLGSQIGVGFRALVDMACIVAASLIAWITMSENGLAGVRDNVPLSILISACLAVAALVLFGSAGVYTTMRREPLGGKLRKLALLNLCLFAAVGVLLMIATLRFGFAHYSLAQLVGGTMLALALATLFTSLARTTSLLLRYDNMAEAATGPATVGHATPADQVLVVGGGGYIGSALVEILLKAGRNVKVLDAMHFGEDPLKDVANHPNLTVVREDFRHVEALTRAMRGVHSVIHLGGLVGDPACAVDPQLTVDMNVTATKLVGEIAKASGVRRFIFASSCSVYGASDEIVDETSPFNPQSLYAKTKVASEAVLSPLNDENFAVTNLRFATVYGTSGRVRFDLVVNLLCAKAVRDGQITVFGPDQWRPFVHVQDVARAIAMTLDAPVDLVAGEVFNVGSDAQNYTLGEAAKMINAQVPEAEIVADHEFKDTRNYRVSFTKIHDKLGFEPAWTVEMGIEQVIGLVRSNHVGHYSLPTYSNVATLKQTGPENFTNFQITGWEQEYMNLNNRQKKASRGEPVAA